MGKAGACRMAAPDCKKQKLSKGPHVSWGSCPQMYPTYTLEVLGQLSQKRQRRHREKATGSPRKETTNWSLLSCKQPKHPQTRPVVLNQEQLGSPWTLNNVWRYYGLSQRGMRDATGI